MKFYAGARVRVATQTLHDRGLSMLIDRDGEIAEGYDPTRAVVRFRYRRSSITVYDLVESDLIPLEAEAKPESPEKPKVQKVELPMFYSDDEVWAPHGCPDDGCYQKVVPEGEASEVAHELDLRRRGLLVGPPGRTLTLRHVHNGAEYTAWIQEGQGTLVYREGRPVLDYGALTTLRALDVKSGAVKGVGGWGVFECPGSDWGYYQIQVDDEAGIIRGDDVACRQAVVEAGGAAALIGLFAARGADGEDMAEALATSLSLAWDLDCDPRTKPGLRQVLSRLELPEHEKTLLLEQA